jgi:hypothetical protein
MSFLSSIRLQRALRRLLRPPTHLNTPGLLVALVVSISLAFAAFAPRPTNHASPSTKIPQNLTFEQAQTASTAQNRSENRPTNESGQSTDLLPSDASEDVSEPQNSETSAEEPPVTPTTSNPSNSCDPYNCNAEDPPLSTGCKPCTAPPRLGANTFCAFYCRD